MLIVTVTLAFKDGASDYEVRDWLDQMQADVECMLDPPQFLAADWPGNCYVFHDHPTRYAPPVLPEGVNPLDVHPGLF